MKLEDPVVAEPHRARRYVLLAALIALLGLTALFRFWPLEQRDVGPKYSTDSSTGDTESTAPVPSRSVGAANAQPEAARKDVHVPQLLEREDLPEYHIQHSPAPVKIVDREGKPMARFRALVGVYRSDDLYKKYLSIRGQLDIGALMDAAGGAREHVTDEDGVLRVEIPSYGRHDASMLVAAKDWNEWSLSGAGADMVDRAPKFNGVHAVSVDKRPRMVTITASRVRRFEVPISFADGRPFTGKVRVMLYAGEYASGPSVDLMMNVDDVSSLNFEGIHDVMRGNISCTSARPGFLAMHSFKVDDAALNALTAIVIPAVDPATQAGLVIDLTSLRQEDGWEFMLLIGATRTSQGFLRWGREYRVLDLNPRRGPYTARIEGRFGQVWDSGPITPIPGEVIHLVPRMQQASRVRCTVLSAEGTPLFPTFAALSERLVPNWDMFRKATDGLRRESEGFAYGNRHGVIVLEGVPSSVTQVYIEAEGHERVAVPVVLTPGQPLDLGEIRLGRAVGSLTVELFDFGSSLDLVAVLRGTDGSFFAQKRFDGRMIAKFEALPFREYRLLIGSHIGSVTTTLDALPDAIRLASRSPDAKAEFYKNSPHKPPPGKTD